MADYECFPLWKRGANGTVNVDPETLPISAELAQELLRWATTYDSTLNRADPLASGFSDRRAEEGFYDWGARLARQIATELSPQYRVEYFDGRDGAVRPIT